MIRNNDPKQRGTYRREHEQAERVKSEHATHSRDTGRRPYRRDRTRYTLED